MAFFYAGVLLLKSCQQVEKLREEVSRLCSIRADKRQTGSRRVAETLEGCAPIQRDLDRLER